MGETTHLLHGFSYASAMLPDNSNQFDLLQRNLLHALRESVSFGRFESLSSFDSKWSHKKYVEEAARYAQPGSVAQKKAFFEAHYKTIAAKKAAAAAEAAAALIVLQDSQIDADDHQQRVIFTSPIEATILDQIGTSQMDSVSSEDNPSETTMKSTDSLKKSLSVQSLPPANHGSSLKTSDLSLQKSLIVPSTPANRVTPLNREASDIKSTTKPTELRERSSDNSFCRLTDKQPSRKLDPTSKHCSTPITTPFSATKVEPTPQYRTRSMMTPKQSCETGRKSTGHPKWQALSAVCTKSLTGIRNTLKSPVISSPFILRTDERAAKRKQKLEDKFRENITNKVPSQIKDKTGRKLSYSFCFKARPMPEFYKDREKLSSQTNRKPTSRLQPFPARQCTPPSKPLAKSVSMKNVSKLRTPLNSLPHENESPNITH